MTNRIKIEIKESLSFNLYKHGSAIVITDSTLRNNILGKVSDRLYKSLISIDSRNPERLHITHADITDVDYDTEIEQLNLVISLNYVYRSIIPFVNKSDEKNDSNRITDGTSTRKRRIVCW